MYKNVIVSELVKLSDAHLDKKNFVNVGKETLKDGRVLYRETSGFSVY